MRTDRELLELAAKAAGVVGVFEHGFIRVPAPGFGNAGFICWNPLTDDGDALRLAVALDILVSPIANSGDDAYARVRAVDRDICLGEPHGADKYAAVRCAIVRAAAEIGAAM